MARMCSQRWFQSWLSCASTLGRRSCASSSMRFGSCCPRWCCSAACRHQQRSHSSMSHHERSGSLPSTPARVVPSPHSATTRGPPSTSRLPLINDPDPPLRLPLRRPSDVEAWEASGFLEGSALDASDGFLHASDARMIRTVASMFFRGKKERRGWPPTPPIPPHPAHPAHPVEQPPSHTLTHPHTHTHAHTHRHAPSQSTTQPPTRMPPQSPSPLHTAILPPLGPFSRDPSTQDPPTLRPFYSRSQLPTSLLPRAGWAAGSSPMPASSSGADPKSKGCGMRPPSHPPTSAATKCPHARARAHAHAYGHAHVCGRTHPYAHAHAHAGCFENPHRSLWHRRTDFVRVLPDGCLHVHLRSPLPMHLVNIRPYCPSAHWDALQFLPAAPAKGAAEGPADAQTKGS